MKQKILKLKLESFMTLPPTAAAFWVFDGDEKIGVIPLDEDVIKLLKKALEKHI